MYVYDSYSTDDHLFILSIIFSHRYHLNGYADGSIVKEKLWTLIAQSELSLISVQLVTPTSFQVSNENSILFWHHIYRPCMTEILKQFDLFKGLIGSKELDP